MYAHQVVIDIQGALQTILTDSENFGSLAAKDITTSGNGVLQLIINGVGEYDIFGETPYDDVNIKHAGVYDVTQNDTGAFIVSEKAVADIAADTGADNNAKAKAGYTALQSVITSANTNLHVPGDDNYGLPYSIMTANSSCSGDENTIAWKYI